MFTSNKSEYEPLIDTTQQYGSSSSLSTETPKRSYSYKIGLFCMLTLITTAILIYHFSASPPIPSNHAPKTINWLQMEASHAHSSHVPKSWAEKEECDDSHPFILTLALKQQNTEALHDHVAEVSHPSNTATFHKYWSAEKVRSYFAPSHDALDAVTAWLKENGFSAENGAIDMVTSYGNAMRVTLTCGAANKLLNAKYMFYENNKNGRTHLRVQNGEYFIPDTVHQHIDFISPTIRFPLNKHTLKVETMNSKQLELIKSHTRDSLTKLDDAKSGGKNKEDDEDSDSDSNITPNIPLRIYELYHMTESVADIIGDDTESLDNSVCRQSVASFIEQYYSDTDIGLFWEDLDVYPESDMERVPATQPQGFGSEAELDTQYMTSTGKGIYTYVYYIESEDIFVSLAEAILSTDIPPLVVSISYGADEYELGQDWVTRCNEEFGKLALIGTTVLASSGDSGVKGNDDDCLYGDAADYEQEQERQRNRGLLSAGQRISMPKKSRTGKGTSSSSSSSSTDYSFIASFPASAPYVTAVGGTEGGLVQDDVASSTGETAWLYSGGGFSIYFDAPDWQTNAINSYLGQDSVSYPDESRYTSTGRAYPDLSAQSVDYVIAYDSAFYLVSGTSASSPTVAGMISMINYARIQAGKSSLGFLNPSLYELYDSDPTLYFNDVTEGYNIGCSVDGNVGFYAAQGWDPLTGLGTPKFSSLYQALLDLD